MKKEKDKTTCELEVNKDRKAREKGILEEIKDNQDHR